MSERDLDTRLLEKYIEKFEQDILKTPHPEQSSIAEDKERIYSPLNILKRLKEIKKAGRLRDEVDREIYAPILELEKLED
jgi:hypothetical protein